MTDKIIRLGVLMDPIDSINIKKDSSFAMLLEAQKRGWDISYLEQGDVYLEDGIVHAQLQALSVEDNTESWFELGKPKDRCLDELDVLLMRKDPPFDIEYIYSTYLLEMAEKQGLLVINRSESIRSCNEKLFATWFPQYCPETLVSRNQERIKQFHDTHDKIVVKPLDGMGGAMIFQLHQGDNNRNVILEAITDHGKRTIMAQRFLPEYKQGDKRILIIDGKAFPYALARLPVEGEGRANLAAGGSYKGVALTEREHEICHSIGPILKEKGLMFVGLDVIGDYITEINVTSPTCIRELDTIYDANISALLMDAIVEHLAK
ncbi:MAG: glutathione synthase [Thiotrichaceae bacterium]|nr:glutathione synthase [Thiotrichaceae bacterium]